ncbi:N-acetylglutaminylglutamine synthetase [Rhizobium sp. PAMB 3174]
MSDTKKTTSVTQRGRDGYGHRLKRMREQGLKPPIAHPQPDEDQKAESDFALDCGWGRLVFAQTFTSPDTLAGALREEKADRRDIALYVRDPHVLLASAPQEIFLDPSHTYRLDLSGYRPSKRTPKGYFIRRLTSQRDAIAINRIYASRSMVQVPPEFFWSKRDARAIIYFVAEDERTGQIIGTVTGVDHMRAFNDSERGSSLWCLAVDPQARHAGIGEALVRRLAEYSAARGASFLDLSVLHDNEQAIALYEKLGFQRVPFFSVKRKNSINERLFTRPETDEGLNPYAAIIVKEARRRGIQVDIMDAGGGFFRLTHGGVSIRCRESLSELTSAVAMSICDDKATTRRIVEQAGVRVPPQISGDAGSEAVSAFLAEHGSLVVKPARGEQGRGISIGLTTEEDVAAAVAEAKSVSNDVLIEAMIEGQDLRLVVINYRLVAAAIRRPPIIVGDGRSTAAELIAAQSRRRAAATGGESEIPVDAETRRTLAAAGYSLKSVIPADEEVMVRRTANLHTGGTIHDVTEEVHPVLIEAAVKAARAIDIPVTGIDLMVKSPHEADYAFIEANERPGLANHEPQPTVERFIDLLFPLSMPEPVRQAMRRTGV